MNTDPTDLVPTLFYYVLPGSRVKPGDVLYEINGRPLRGGPMTIKKARHRGHPAGWELVPETSRVSRFVDPDAQLRVGRAAPTLRVDAMIVRAAATVRKPKRRKSSRSERDQLSMFEIPGVTK